jgi:hypothetical protein
MTNLGESQSNFEKTLTIADPPLGRVIAAVIARIGRQQIIPADDAFRSPGPRHRLPKCLWRRRRNDLRSITAGGRQALQPYQIAQDARKVHLGGRALEDKIASDPQLGRMVPGEQKGCHVVARYAG